MIPARRTIRLLAFLATLAAMQGCDSCQQSAPPPPPPTPVPVQGNLPQLPPTAPAAAAEAKDICALLIFSNEEQGASPFTVQLTAEGDCTRGQARFDWDFGDGSPAATGETVVHTFEKPGTYTVKGKVTSDELPGEEDVDEVDIIVTSPQG